MAAAVHVLDTGTGERPGLPAGMTWDDDGGCDTRLLFGAADALAIARGLTAPYQGFIERCGDDGSGFARAAAVVRAGGLVLSLTTRTAYRLDVTRLIADGARRRFHLSEAVAGRLEQALGEAVANAVVHGNLGLSSEFRQSVNGLARFGQLLSERLDDPVLCGRRVEIAVQPGHGALVATVTDQGAGFDAAHLAQHGAAAGGKCGRGFVLMKSVADRVAFEDGGRRVRLSFAGALAP
ncbi:MAG: ATP-binding protein [Magnetospirillum sp.]|nr:ATP-binding protein [Magnetospirillum sp.]